MDELHDFSDNRQKSWCIHCARFLSKLNTSKDHVPTKTLLMQPYPPNLPTVIVCHDCNQGFSKDEQYMVSFLSSVISGTTDPAAQLLPGAQRILRYNAELRSVIQKSKTEYRTISGETQLQWKPDDGSIRRVVIKNARGHAFYEYGEPMLREPDSVSVVPFAAMTPTERADFENVPSSGLWPEVGSRMMTRVLTAQDLDGPWVIVQDNVYRYTVAQDGEGMLVRLVMAEYLAAEVSWDG